MLPSSDTKNEDDIQLPAEEKDFKIETNICSNAKDDRQSLFESKASNISKKIHIEIPTPISQRGFKKAMTNEDIEVPIRASRQSCKKKKYIEE